MTHAIKNRNYKIKRDIGCHSLNDLNFNVKRKETLKATHASYDLLKMALIKSASGGLKDVFIHGMYTHTLATHRERFAITF